jgi:hypothetical protein
VLFTKTFESKGNASQAFVYSVLLFCGKASTYDTYPIQVQLSLPSVRFFSSDIVVVFGLKPGISHKSMPFSAKMFSPVHYGRRAAQANVPGARCA